MKLPSDYKYTDTHMWVHLGEDGLWWVGVTDYAQEMLGDVVFIDPPKKGGAIQQHQPCGVIESVKTSSHLHAPLTGEVIEVNNHTTDYPELVNDKPYTTWLFKLSANAQETEQLLNATQYQAIIE